MLVITLLLQLVLVAAYSLMVSKLNLRVKAI